MRKLFLAVFLLLGLGVSASAQSVQIQTGMTATAATTGSGIATPTTYYHQVTWTVSGTVATCSFTIDSSSDNSSWSSGGVIPATTCTSGGVTGLINAAVGYIRINLGTFTGSGKINIQYAGYSAGIGGTTLSAVGAPTGACTAGTLYTNTSNGILYSCNAGTWAQVGSGASVAFSALTGSTNTTAAMVIGTGASLTVSGSGTNNATTLNGATFAAPGAIGGGTAAAATFTTITAGTDNSVAGTLTLANSAAVAHTIFSSGATTTNTIAGFTAVPTTGDLISCTSASTTCTLTDAGFLATNVVRKDAANTGAAAMTLNMAASTTANSLVAPAQAGLTSGTDGAIAYDTTAKNTHIRANGADALAVAEASAIASGFIPMSTSATISLVGATLCDQAITTANTLTCTNTAGLKVVNVQTGTSPPTCTIGTAGALCQGEGTAPTGAASVDDLYADSTSHALTAINNNTNEGPLLTASRNLIWNSNQAAQSQVVVSATEYYVTNSNLNMPATYRLAIGAGTTMHWRISLTKTAAGTGTFQILLKKGTAGTTGDTSIVTQTIGTQTAAADNMEVDITLTFTSTTAAFWSMVPHQSAASGTGFGLVYPAAAAQFTGTISAQTTTTASDKYGVSLVFTTGTPTFVVNQVFATANGVL